MNTLTRRSAITVSTSAACWAGMPRKATAEEAPTTEVAAAVTAPEDLMREHGVLNRLMLVYEAEMSSPASKLKSIHEVFHETASLIRSFIEDYHGMLEEKFLFPEFDGHREHAKLVQTLREQHRVGRALTGVVLRHATAGGLADDATRADVTRACQDFIHMFRAHEAWEDTVLFPAFRGRPAGRFWGLMAAGQRRWGRSGGGYLVRVVSHAAARSLIKTARSSTTARSSLSDANSATTDSIFA